MMQKSVRTSSFGRLLDALSYSLGVCKERTYDGEPAMKLEPLLARGKLVDGFEPETAGGTIRYTHLFENLKGNPEDVAYSIVHGVLEKMVESAFDSMDSKGYECIGLTGGVSYNSTITRIVSDLADGDGRRLILHRDVPNGDGGISVGQTAIALKRT